MAIQIRINQGVSTGEINRSRDDIVAGTEVVIENVSPGTDNDIELLWKSPDDDSAAFIPDGDNWKITPKAGTWGRAEFKVTIDGEELRLTFTVVSPVHGLSDFAANERANPDASLLDMGPDKIEQSSTNQAFGPFSSGSAFGWWKTIRDFIEKLEALFHPSTGHDHSGADDNGPPTAHSLLTNNPHGVDAAQAGADPAGSAAAVASDLSTHESDNTNPHSVTAAQAGAAPTPHALDGSDHSALSDVTDFDVSITKHGFAPKLPNDASKYLDGTGGYTAPPGGVADTTQDETGQTTTASPLNIDSYTTLAADRVITMRATVFGYQSATAGGGTVGDIAKYVVELSIKRVGGTVTIRDENVISQFEDNAAWDVAFSVNGTDIDVNVTGIANGTIEWRSQLEISEHG